MVQNFISAYATMHPWEDFAETWATYLDMISGLDTAQHVGFGGVAEPIEADLDDMVKRYQQLGIALNEVNRSMGLLDVVPEVFVEPVVAKLRFIHQLVAGRAENGALGGQPPVSPVEVNPAPAERLPALRPLLPTPTRASQQRASERQSGRKTRTLALVLGRLGQFRLTVEPRSGKCAFPRV